MLFGVKFLDQVGKPRVAADDRQRASGVERLYYGRLTVTKARMLPVAAGYAEVLLRLALPGPPLPLPFGASIFTRPLQSG